MYTTVSVVDGGRHVDGEESLWSVIGHEFFDIVG